MKYIQVAVVAFVVVVGGTIARPNSPPPTLEELVARLGSDDFAEREAAMNALLAAGPEAIPTLEQALNSENPEIVRRARQLLMTLRRQHDNARLMPQAVSLDYRQVPLDTAVRDLQRRLGLVIALDTNHIADPLRLVTCITGPLPPWEALAVFCRTAGLREVFAPELPIPASNRTYQPPPPDAADVPVVLRDGPPEEIPGHRTSAVRVLVLPASFPGHRLELGTGVVTLCFDVTPLPGIHWQGPPAVRITRVIDDAGRVGGAGHPMSETRSRLLNSDLGNAWRVQCSDSIDRHACRGANPNPRIVPVPLRLATPSTRTLRVLEGSVFGTILVPGHRIVQIDNPTQAVGTPFAVENDMRITLLEIDSTGNQTRIVVRINSPSPWLSRTTQPVSTPLLPDAPKAESLTQRMIAFNDRGELLPRTTSDLMDVSDDGVRLVTVTRYEFQGTMPARLQYAGPRAAVVEIPFTFAKVPLP